MELGRKITGLIYDYTHKNYVIKYNVQTNICKTSDVFDGCDMAFKKVKTNKTKKTISSLLGLPKHYFGRGLKRFICAP